MTNAAAIGYMILAAKQIKLPKEIMEKLECAMYEEMDVTSEEYAERVYHGY